MIWRVVPIGIAFLQLHLFYGFLPALGVGINHLLLLLFSLVGHASRRLPRFAEHRFDDLASPSVYTKPQLVEGDASFAEIVSLLEGTAPPLLAGG